MSPDRVVPDTSVLISAALNPEGKPRAVLESLKSVCGTLLFSVETFDEPDRTIMETKLDEYVSKNI